MTDEKRPYRKRRRAESEAQTRLRITESAVALHGTLGPARTSISAIADHAGVRRSTVYRHFADESTLFVACSSLWLSDNPPPDISRWAAIDDPGVRVRAALSELYAYYRRAERMLANLYRDEAEVPAVKERFRGFRQLLAASRETLMRGQTARGAARVRVGAAIGHALAFSTWRSLARDQDLSDEQAAELMWRLVVAAAQLTRSRSAASPRVALSHARSDR
jgi:AcrR family transcriptional regulator